MDDNEDEQAGGGVVVAQVVPLGLRMRALHSAFGSHCVLVEGTVFTMLRRLSPQYDGGYWQFYTLSNGGFYMAPDGEGTLRLSCEGNGYAGTVSADAAGIVASLMALSHLSFIVDDQDIVRVFHRLRDFAADHAEHRAIFRAID